VCKKILVVEDHENILDLLKAIFRDSGYQIFCVRDGSEALNIANMYKPDIVLLDIQLPKINGLDVCNSMKRSTVLSNTKVLMLSGRTQNSDLNQAHEMGADGYITKPFRPGELMQKVEELLHSS
jgi:DNA-binding response OmpR family regulator